MTINYVIPIYNLYTVIVTYKAKIYPDEKPNGNAR
jgi:hypothetical protein